MLVNGVGQSGHGVTQTATQTISGVLVLALAGFAPWLAIKLVHWSGDHFQQLHTMAGTAAVGAQKVMSAPQKARSLAMAVTGGGAAAAGAAASGGAAAGQVTGSGFAGATRPTSANGATSSNGAGSTNGVGSSGGGNAPTPSTGGTSPGGGQTGAPVTSTPTSQAAPGTDKRPDALVGNGSSAFRTYQQWPSQPSEGSQP
jgi:type IV secretion system protein TrbL